MQVDMKGDLNMTLLDCSVTNCLYNKDNLCSKGDITIGGKNAKSMGETCCESFRERTGSSTMNSIAHPTENIDVDCEAENCKYNADCKCQAGHIGISGSQACRCADTECASFCCK